MADTDKIEYLITNFLHPLLPRNDTVLVVINDVLCGDYPTKWHNKEKYIAVARQCGCDLVLLRQARLSDNIQTVIKPSSGVVCEVVTPRLTTGQTREEYLILAHPLDAQVILLSMRQSHTVEVVRRLALSAGNMAALTQQYVTTSSLTPVTSSATPMDLIDQLSGCPVKQAIEEVCILPGQ
jgi:hypothetical protein